MAAREADASAATSQRQPAQALGVTALSAFSSMAHQLKAGETELTGFLEDSSARFGVLA